MEIKQRLLAVAEVFEETAAYLEEKDAQKLHEVRQAKQAQAQNLAEKISHAVGEDVDESMVEKLSELSPEMSQLVQRLSGGDAVDSLGGPPEAVKTAGILGPDAVANGVQAANSRFISWVTH